MQTIVVIQLLLSLLCRRLFNDAVRNKKILYEQSVLP